ncbi:MAG: hypothetical protein HQK75_09275, partial [Candidatus Magnetomorum sp.]|nr:hypothetical protein [Candidatus Magnetomorum sp.]
RQEMAKNQALNDKKFEQVRTAFAQMDVRMVSMQNTIIKWVVALFIASMSINIALIKLL